MIRRPWPLGAESPARYLLIPQQEHARLSHKLAAGWGGPAHAEPLVCPPDAGAHPLAGVRREFLAAMLHHDDGWAKWWANPGIDPEHDRPYSFTEMPPPDAQRLWSESIKRCRDLGPLAGWVVASHFSQLQSKVDHDYDQWVSWLAGVDAERAVWLADWLAASPDHTLELADRCLTWLRAFDWMSLWLCCKCPVAGEPPTGIDPLVIGGEDGLAEATFTPSGDGVVVDPWPFSVGDLELTVSVESYPRSVESAAETALRDSGPANTLAWLCKPAD